MARLLLGAALALAVPTAGFAQEPASTKVQTSEFSYTRTQLTGQSYKIEGRFADGRGFRLVVRGRQVTGDMGGLALAFQLRAPQQERQIFASAR